MAALVSISGLFFALQPGLAQPADRSYNIPLTSYVPGPGDVIGLLLKVRINGGPPLRMLLDSGATHVVIDRRAASRSGLSTGADLPLVGLGFPAPAAGREGRAQTVAIGELEFRDAVVDVAPARLADGIDGAIPTALFRGFLLRLDLPAKSLQLTPFPEEGPRDAGFAPFVPVKNLLFVPAVLNQVREGYVLLDTGACYTAISPGMAKSLRSSLGEVVQMVGSAGAVQGERVASGVQFRLAGREFHADPVMALDMSTISSYNGLEVAGLLGYPGLRTSVVTIDYRNSLVKIEAKAGARR